MLCKKDITKHLRLGLAMTEQSGIALKTTLTAWMEPSGSVCTLEVRTHTGKESQPVSVNVNVSSESAGQFGGFSAHRLASGDVEQFAVQLYDQIVKFFKPLVPNESLRFGVELGWEATTDDAPKGETGGMVVFTGYPVIPVDDQPADAIAPDAPTPGSRMTFGELKRTFAKTFARARLGGWVIGISVDAVGPDSVVVPDVASIIIDGAGTKGQLDVVVAPSPALEVVEGCDDIYGHWTLADASADVNGAADLCEWIERTLERHGALKDRMASVSFWCSESAARYTSSSRFILPPFERFSEMSCTTGASDFSAPAIPAGLSRHHLQARILEVMSAVRKHRDAAQIRIDVLTSVVFPGIDSFAIIQLAMKVDGSLEVRIQSNTSLEIPGDHPTLWHSVSEQGDASVAKLVLNHIEALIYHHPRLKYSAAAVSFATCVTVDGLMPSALNDTATAIEAVTAPPSQGWRSFINHLETGLNCARANGPAASCIVDLLSPEDFSESGNTLTFIVRGEVDPTGQQSIIIWLHSRGQDKSVYASAIVSASLDESSRNAVVEVIRKTLLGDAVYIPRFKPIWYHVPTHEVSSDADVDDGDKTTTLYDDLLPTTKEQRNVVESIIAQDWNDFSKHLDSGLGYSSANNFNMTSEVFLITAADRAETGKSISVFVRAASQPQGSHRVIVQLRDRARGDVPVFTTAFSVSLDKESREDAVEQIKALVPTDTDYLLRFNSSWQIVLHPDETAHPDAVKSAEADDGTPTSAYAEFAEKPLTPHLLKELFQKFGDSTDREITIDLEPESDSTHWLELVRHSSGLFTLTVILGHTWPDDTQMTLSGVAAMRTMAELMRLFWFLNLPLTVPDTGRKLDIISVDSASLLQGDCIPDYLPGMGQAESDSILLRTVRCIPTTGGTDADRAAYGADDCGLGWYGDIFDAATAFRKAIDALPLRCGASRRRVVDGYVCDMFEVEPAGGRWVRALNEFIEGHAIQLNSTMAQQRWEDYSSYALRDGVSLPGRAVRITPSSNVNVLCRYTGIDLETGKLNCEFITEPSNSQRVR